MRTFVAFTLPPDIEQEIVQWQQANLPAGVFPEPATNLHMTLAFLGETPDELVGPINDILAQLDPSTVTISGPVAYEEQARLAFLTYNEQGGTAVWEQLNAALKDLMGYEPQFRPWLPHTTVWRFAPDHKPNINPPLPDISFSPIAVTLYQSVRNENGQGATYQKVGNVFDPISHELDQRVFNGTDPKPSVIHFVKNLFDRAFLQEFGVHNDGYVHLYLTGSLTTYQYGPSSDCDTSAFPNYPRLEKLTGSDDNEIRKRLIKMNIEHLDGTFLPGGSHPIQVFATPKGVLPQDSFSPGTRSAWDYQTKEWLVPPEKDRVHSIENEFPEVYARAARIADKMTEMLDAKNYKAADQLWVQVHKKRQLDQHNGGGDFSEGNIVYKFLVHEGIVQRLRDEMHLQIETKIAADIYSPEWYEELQQQYGEEAYKIIHRFDSIWPPSVEINLEYADYPAEQTEFVLNEGYEWKFDISDGKAFAWGDGEVMSFNDGMHPHTYVMYDDLNVEKVTDKQAIGWIIKPPLKEGDKPYLVNIRGGEAYTDEQILQMLTLAPGEGRVERSKEPARLGTVGPITMKVIYDPQLDHIILGTQADVHDGKTIIGEYKNDEVTLHRNPYQFLNANYFRRLWSFSFPKRPLNKVHLQEPGIDGKKIEMPTKPPRHVHMAMAEQSGDPTLDGLIQKFLSSEFTNRAMQQMKVDALRDPDLAAGECGHITQAFERFVRNEGGLNASFRVMQDHDRTIPWNVIYPDFKQFNYDDRPMMGEHPSHAVLEVETDSGTFLVDFSAAQYGYTEMPLIQKQDNDSWMRDF